MYIQASKLIGLSVGNLDTRSKIAEIKQIFVDIKKGEIIGFLCKTGGFFGSRKIISINDVLDFDKNAIIIRSEDELSDLDEIIRIKKIIDKDLFIIGMKARTESGEDLGKVYDFIFDSEELKITKYYLGGIFTEKILPAKKVVKIDENKHEIVFSDDVIKVTKLKRTKKAVAQKALA